MRAVGKFLLLTPLWVARYSLFIMMLVFGRLAQWLLCFMSGCGLLMFFGCLIVGGQQQAMFIGLGLALGCGALSVAWHMALQALAPDGMGIVSDV